MRFATPVDPTGRQVAPAGDPWRALGREEASLAYGAFGGPLGALWSSLSDSWILGALGGNLGIPRAGLEGPGGWGPRDDLRDLGGCVGGPCWEGRCRLRGHVYISATMSWK